MTKIQRVDDFVSVYDRYRLEVEEALGSGFCINTEIETKLYDAMSYSLFAGGKRFRPVLLMLIYDSLDGSQQLRPATMKMALALEMIHTYSLIHDDLPSMDNDDYRRGQLTNHRQFDEATAILAGDALLNRAYELLFEVSLEHGPSAVRASAAIAHFAGANGMIGGQIIDLDSEGKHILIERLEELQIKKTGGLLRAACAAATHMALGDQEHVSEDARSRILGLLDAYGICLGLAFQIQDDILDVTSDLDQMGKTVGKDARDIKSTFVSMLGLDGAIERLDLERKKTEDICENLALEGINSQHLYSLAEWQMKRKN